MPPKNAYYKFEDTVQERNAFNKWYEEELSNGHFHFKDSILQIIYQSTYISAKCLLQYLKNTLIMQQDMIPHFTNVTFLHHVMSNYEQGLKPYVHPFSYPICSSSGLSYNIFKVFSLPDDLYGIKNELLVYTNNCSEFERNVAEHLESLYPDFYIEHAFSSTAKQRSFSGYTPDMYIPRLRRCYFANGCGIHLHISRTCRYNKFKTRDSTSWTKKNYGKENDRQNEIFKLLKKNHPQEIKRITIIWQCEFEAMQRKQKKKRLKLPVTRLSLSQALKGGRCDYFQVFFSKENNPNYDLMYLDVVSLYPYMMLKDFSCGLYSRHMGKHLESCIEIIDGHLYFEKRRLYGLCQVSILPCHSSLPFLSYRRTDNNQLVYTNCSACAKKGIQRLSCNHSINERAILDTLTVAEIEYALSIGHKVLRWHEIARWDRQKPFLSKFIRYFGKKKIMHSKVQLEKDMSVLDYCEMINSKMSFSANESLKPEDLNENRYFRTVIKQILNSLYGTLSARSYEEQTAFVSSYSELHDIYAKGNLLDILSLHSKYCHVQVKNKPREMNRKNHSLSGAEITAYARIFMHKHMLTFKDDLYYIDTDSLIFKLRKGVNHNLPISPAFGNWTDELVDFDCRCLIVLGCKSYAMLLQCKETGKFQAKLHLKGISLSSCVVNNYMCFEAYQYEFTQFLQNAISNSHILQRRNIRDQWDKETLAKRFTLIAFSHSLLNKRARVNSDYTTKPYGYKLGCQD